MQVRDLRSLKVSLKVLLLFSTLLAISAGLNVYLFFEIIGPPRREAETGTPWIYGYTTSRMMTLAIKLTRDRIFYPPDGQFNVSVKASCWAPFSSESRSFNFKIYDRRIYYQGSFDESSKLLREKTLIVNKTEAVMYYEFPVFNFTITLDKPESTMHLYSIVEAMQRDATLDDWDCMVAFAINFVW